MKVHSIIRYEVNLLEFIDWLPELVPDERFYLCLQARKKYMPSLKASDKTQLKRFLSTKDRLLEKIRQLECPVGSYTTKEGVIIPDEGMALYITLNPRCLKKATYEAIRALTASLKNRDENKNVPLNPHSEVMSQIHKAKSRTTFVHYDIDMPVGDENDGNAEKSDLSVSDVYAKAVDIVGREAVIVVTTRGGCHVLVDPKLVVCETKNWHPILAKTLKSDQVGDLMIPVVGCNQGGFVPRFFRAGRMS